MKLPAICLSSTPVSMPCVTVTPACHSRCLMVMSLPTIPTAAQCQKSQQSIPRLNPLRPPLVLKRTVSMETPSVHHHNHQRSLIMQKREHYRYHQMWRKPFYGTSSEKEEYRKEIREQLKKQMEEKSVGLKLQMANNMNESENVFEKDQLALYREREERVQQSRAMTIYRDENKKLMEQRWTHRALTRSLEALKERELLRLNPINWNGTLK